MYPIICFQWLRIYIILSNVTVFYNYANEPHVSYLLKSLLEWEMRAEFPIIDNKIRCTNEYH